MGYFNWFKPKLKKASYQDKVFIYICAYAYDQGTFDKIDGIIEPLLLPPIRDIEFITKINRQYISMALNQLVYDKFIERVGTGSRKTQFRFWGMSKREIEGNLLEYKEEYPGLFYSRDSFNRMLNKILKSQLHPDKLNEVLNIMPDFEKW